MAWFNFKNFMFDISRRLFLPKHIFHSDKPSLASSELVRHMKTFISTKEIYGCSSSIPEIEKLLKPLNPRAALAWLSVINISVEQKGILDTKFQETAARNFFPDEKVFQRAVFLMRRDKSIIIHSAQVETLERLVVLNSYGDIADNERVLPIIGEALIKLADCFERNDVLVKDFDKRPVDERRRIFREYSIRNYYVNNGDQLELLIPRSLRIIRDLPKQLVGHQDYLDLSSVVSESLGMSLNRVCRGKIV